MAREYKARGQRLTQNWTLKEHLVRVTLQTRTVQNRGRAPEKIAITLQAQPWDLGDGDYQTLKL